MDGCCGLRRRLLASRTISRRSRLVRLRQEALDPGLFLVPDRRRFNAAPASLIAAGLAALGVSRTDAFEIAESREPRGACDVTRYPHIDVKVTGEGIKY